jgi:glycosyltransferase involved in cell wall biosynthesis
MNNSQKAATKPERISLLCFGNPKKKVKGTRFILKALKLLNPPLPAELTLFDRTPLKLPVRVGQVKVHTFAAPSQSQLKELYQTADIFLSAEISAGWSNTVAEAMACQTAVVCTPIGTADLAIHEQTALLVPPKKLPPLARAIERLIKESKLRTRLAHNAFLHVQKFSWQNYTRNLLQLIREKCNLA